MPRSLFLLPLIFLLLFPAVTAAKPVTKEERAMALKTLRSYEKIYMKTARLKTPAAAVKEVRSELFCTEQMINKINKSKKINDDDKFFYIFAFVILFQADARSTLARSVEGKLLTLGERLKKKSVILEKKAQTKRGKRIARGLLAQALMAEDYLRMPEAHFCQEYEILEEEGYDADTAFMAYINLVNWDIQEWATSKESEYAINMLYASYNPMFNARPSFSTKRLTRFEDMHVTILLPWERKKKARVDSPEFLLSPADPTSRDKLFRESY